MSDPFDALRRDLGSTEPPPEFRRRLLADLRALEAAHRGRTEAREPVEPSRNEARIDDEVVVMALIQSSPSRRAKRPLFLAGAALAAAAALVVALILADRDSPVVVSNPPNTTIEVSPTTGNGPTSTTVDPPLETGFPAVEPYVPGGEVFPAPQFSTSVAIDGSTVWVAPDSSPISRYDLATGKLLGTVGIQSGAIASRPVFGFGSMWVATDIDDTLHRIDSTTGDVLASIPIDGDIRGSTYLGLLTATVSDDAVWVVSFDAAGSKLYRVDPATNAVTGSIPAPLSATNVYFAAGSLWVLGADGPFVRIDPADGRELASFPLAATFNTVIRYGLDTIWVHDVDGDGAKLLRIDPANNTVTAEVRVPGRAEVYVRTDVAFAAGFAWTSSPTSTLVKIDPSTNKVVARYGDARGGAGLAATATDIWFTEWSGKQLHRMPVAS